jgi:TnpA family transposase
MVLNERQAGAAIEGVVRDEHLETAQLAVDTHGHTDVAMALARLLGFDLCPRLKALKDRHLFLPRGAVIPQRIRSICHANVDLAKILAHWDEIVHLVASCAAMVAFVAGPEASYVTGANLTVDGGMNA